MHTRDDEGSLNDDVSYTDLDSRMYRYITYLHNYCRECDVLRQEIQLDIGSGLSSVTYLRPPEHNSYVLLVCHSLGADRYYPFTELFLDLLAQRYAVFTIDLDGHGQGQSHLLSYPGATTTLPRAIEYLVKEYGIPEKHILLFGHSLGGAFCLYEAARNVCGGLITVAAPHRIEIGPWAGLELLSFLNSAVLRQFRYYSFRELLPAFSSFKREEFPCRTHSGTASYIETTGEILRQMSIPDNISKAELPFLQIHGRLDCVVPYLQARQIHHSYAGPKELLSLKYDTHFTSLFSQACRRKILTWLAQNVTSNR